MRTEMYQSETMIMTARQNFKAEQIIALLSLTVIERHERLRLWNLGSLVLVALLVPQPNASFPNHGRSEVDVESDQIKEANKRNKTHKITSPHKVIV
jgi:hypothetical protein